MAEYPRLLEARVRVALADTPVVLVNGARQTGKSTLAQRLIGEGGCYLTLDNLSALAAARDDPHGFVGDATGLTVIDEVQKAPDLFAAIKHAVDARRQAGRFLLTGSADVFMLPDAAESLAGRMEVLTLHPLAQAEMTGVAPDFLEALFANRVPAVPESAGAPGQRVVAGGFPEALARRGADRRRAWFDAYVTTITQRDIRDLSEIEGLTALPRLLSLMAARSGGLLNAAELSRAAGIAQATLRRYLALLEATFLFTPLPAWHANLGKRLIKTPKAYLIDSGLACALGGLDADTLSEAPHYGGLLETFVLGELRRLLAASPSPPRLYHYRSAGGVEVDFVLEDAQGRIAGIEVKSARTVTAKHFSGLRDLSDHCGRRFVAGVVLYGGAQTLPFGPKLHAWPLASLWSAV